MITGAAQRQRVTVRWAKQNVDERGVYRIVKFWFWLGVPLDDLTQEGGLEEFEKGARERLEAELEKLRGVRWSGGGIMAKAPEKSNGMAAPASNSKCKEDTG